jgi:hypothetical protein
MERKRNSEKAKEKDSIIYPGMNLLLLVRGTMITYGYLEH